MHITIYLEISASNKEKQYRDHRFLIISIHIINQPYVNLKDMQIANFIKYIICKQIITPHI